MPEALIVKPFAACFGGQSMLAGLRRLNHLFLDLLFPRRCVVCHREGTFLCGPCLAAFPRLLPPLCPVCGTPNEREGLCHSCEARRPAIDGIRSLFRYEGPVRETLHQLKYGNLPGLAETLGVEMAQYLEQGPFEVHVVVPVPLHPRRLRQRGYNQAALLARPMASLPAGRQGLGKLPVREDLLRRTRDTPAQARSAGAEARQRNVKGAFACSEGDLTGTAVLLIDDVCTTGATLEACALALKEAGAQTVWGLTLAREV